MEMLEHEEFLFNPVPEVPDDARDNKGDATEFPESEDKPASEPSSKRRSEDVSLPPTLVEDTDHIASALPYHMRGWWH